MGSGRAVFWQGKQPPPADVAKKSRLAFPMVIWKPATMSDRESPSFHAVFNYGEACLWFVLAIALALRLRMARPWRWLLPLAFAVFGVSDSSRFKPARGGSRGGCW